MVNPRKLPSLAVALLMSVAAPASADDASARSVTLSGSEGGSDLVGELVSFDDTVFVIRTRIGDLSIARSSVTCTGAACPPESSESAPFTAAADGRFFDLDIAVNDPHLVDLLQTMTTRFAKGEALNALAVPSPAGSPKRIELFSGTMEALGESGLTMATMSQADSLSAMRAGQVNLTVDSSGDLDHFEGQTDGQKRIMGLDALIPLVHPQNIVRAVSVSELAQIATGRITNWSQLGGKNAPINVILPQRNSALDDALTALVLKPNRVRLRARNADARLDPQDALAAMRSDPNAITFAGVTDADQGRVLPIRQTCGPVSLPTTFAIKTEEYPLTRRIMSYRAAGNLTETEDAFMRYLMSDEAQSVIGQLGFVDQTVMTAPLSAQGGRLTSAVLSAEDGIGLGKVQDFARLLMNADRLSTTFRFKGGSLELDDKAQDDIARVVAFLNSPAAMGRRVLLLGFTDEIGRFDLNANRARLKAQAVYAALLSAPGGAALRGRVDLTSYGPLAPVGCNDTAQGRQANRRVEIWLQ